MGEGPDTPRRADLGCPVPDPTRAGDVDAVTARLLAPPAVGGITVPVVIGDKYGSRTVTDISSISPPKGQSSGRRRLKWTCICGATGTCLRGDKEDGLGVNLDG